MNNKLDLEKSFSKLCVISEEEKIFQGNIRWNIPNCEIKSYLELGGKPIESNTFSIGSPSYCSFRFLIYPGKCTEWCPTSPPIFFNETRKVCVRITFNKKFPDSAWIKIKISFIGIDGHKTFNTSGKMFDRKCVCSLFTYSTLEEFFSKGDSELILQCSMKISTRDIKCVFDKEKICYAESRDYDSCKETFAQEPLTDISIYISGQLFKTHKTLLAQIPYFQVLFNTNKSEQFFELTNIDHEIFNCILIFLYSNDIPHLNFKLACELYIVANDLKIDDLKCLCSSYLGASLTETNVIMVLKFSHEYKDAALKRECFKFMKKADVETLMEKSIVL